MKVKTWLPIFPGFYNTIFEFDDDYLVYDLEEQGITDKQLEFLWNSDYYSELIKEYRQETARNCTDVICMQLINLDLVKNIQYEAIESPREYNFKNDGINVEIDIKFKNIMNYLKSNKDKFSIYLKEKYTSYDGFASSYSSYIEDWLKPESLKHTHKLGSILHFILLNEGFGQEVLYDGCETSGAGDLEQLTEEMEEKEAA